jgi:hypothetical protein
VRRRPALGGARPLGAPASTDASWEHGLLNFSGLL